MGNLIKLICGTILLISIMSCNNDVNKQLTEISKIIDDNPETAIQLLESINVENLSSAQDKAEYSLLYTWARDKNHLFDKNDSLIDFAVKFFEQKGIEDKAIRAYYYKAKILFNRDDYRNAIVNLLHAEELSTTSEDNYFRGKINELFGDIYHMSCNLNEAITYRKKAVDSYKNSDRPLFYYYAVEKLASAYIDHGDYHKGIDLLDNTDVQPMLSDSIFMCMYNSDYMILHNSIGNYPKALQKLRESFQYLTEPMKPYMCYPEIAIVFLNNEMADSAKIVLDYAMDGVVDNSSINSRYYNALSKYYEQCGRIDSAFYKLKRQFEKYNDKADIILNQSVALSERDYYNEKSELEKARSQRNKERIYLIIAISISAIVAIIIFYRRKVEKDRERFNEQIVDYKSMINDMKHQKENLIAENERLNSLTESSTEQMIKQNELMTTMFRENFGGMNSICAEYFTFKDADNATDALMTKFQKELEILKSAESFKRIEDIVNLCNNDIVSRLLTQIPRLKTIDIKIFTFVIAGFSPRTVSLLCDIKVENYHNRRSRLKHRIETSDAADRDLFLGYMYQQE